VIDEGEQQAFAVTEPGVTVIDLSSDAGPSVLRDVVVTDEPAAEVEITASGDLALARQADSSTINVVDLDDGERRVVELPGAVTDLDLSQDGRVAVAVVRGRFETGSAESGAGGQGGESGLAGAGGEGNAAGGAAGASGDGAGFSESAVAVLPIPGIFSAPETFETVAIPELFGSVVVPPVGNRMLLFTNATPSDRVTILDIETRRWRAVSLKAPVAAVFPSPDAAHAVALLAPPPGSSKAGAFSLIPVAHELPPKLQGTEAPVQGVSLSETNAIVTTRDSSAGGFAAYLAGFPSLRIDPIELPSAPTASGMVPDAEVAYIAEEHPEGRITFVDLDDARARTLTGFELGVKVIDGD
jgi:hypothetical protein